MEENNMNELSDDDLQNVLDEGDSDETLQNTEQSDTENEENSEETDEVPEDTDEDLENLFKPKKKSRKSDKESGKSGNNIDKNVQEGQQNKSNPQDLVDENGNIIAKAGAERRFYEENQRMKREMQQFTSTVLPQIKQQYQQMENELAQYKGVVEGLHAQDLSPQDIQSGLDFVRSWRKNPKEVVKFLLTSLQSSGIDVDIEGMQPSIQAEAIKRMIDEKFKPFEQERENQRKLQQQEEDVNNEYNNFIMKYPDAVVHDKTLAFMIRKNPNLTPEVAYLQLKNYYLQKGLDFSKPLEVLAQESKQPNQGIPSTPTVSEQVAVPKVRQKVANVNNTFKDIVRSAMTDAGI